MSTSEHERRRAQRSPWSFAISALIIIGISYYAVATHATVPPILALFLVAAASLVTNKLLELVEARRANSAVAAASGVALMVSMVSRILLVGWMLWIVLVDSNLLERLRSAEDAVQVVSIAFVLAMCSFLALMTVALINTLWTMVRSNALGIQQHSR